MLDRAYDSLPRSKKSANTQVEKLMLCLNRSQSPSLSTLEKENISANLQSLQIQKKFFYESTPKFDQKYSLISDLQDQIQREDFQKEVFDNLQRFLDDSNKGPMGGFEERINEVNIDHYSPFK